MICFEWLQRPENVLAGYVRWGDYRGPQAQTAIRIEHHKTGAMVLHPLEEVVRGERVLFDGVGAPTRPWRRDAATRCGGYKVRHHVDGSTGAKPEGRTRPAADLET